MTTEKSKLSPVASIDEEENNGIIIDKLFSEYICSKTADFRKEFLADKRIVLYTMADLLLKRHLATVGYSQTEIDACIKPKDLVGLLSKCRDIWLEVSEAGMLSVNNVMLVANYAISLINENIRNGSQ